MQVGSLQLPGYGGQAAKPPGWEDSKPAQLEWGLNGNGGGGGGGTGPFDPRGAFQVPNNFWGFVMLMMGLK